MKQTILRINILMIVLVLVGTGCQKDKIDYDPDSIIGKWEWLYSVGGDLTAIYSYPLNGQVRTVEFRENGDLFFKENSNTFLETNFSISGDTLSYYKNNGVERISKFRILRDTLRLINLFTLGDAEFYKRIE